MFTLPVTIVIGTLTVISSGASLVVVSTSSGGASSSKSMVMNGAVENLACNPRF